MMIHDQKLEIVCDKSTQKQLTSITKRLEQYDFHFII